MMGLEIDVSILILLDVLLQHNLLYIIGYAYIGFNPYFTGCSTSTRSEIYYYRYICKFQSLFYWMFYFNPIRPHNYRDRSAQFQSLFYWMFYFNLGYSPRNVYAWTKFQSLFYWMFYFNQAYRSHSKYENNYVSILILLDVLLQLIVQHGHATLDGRFNPYFTGCSTSTKCFVKPHNFGTFMTFQSLFYWMFYFNNFTGERLQGLPLSGFNPYFTGCSTSTR